MEELLTINEELISKLRKASIVTNTLTEFLDAGCTLLKAHFDSRSIAIYISIKTPTLHLYHRTGINKNETVNFNSEDKYIAGKGLVGQLFTSHLRTKKSYAYACDIDQNIIEQLPPWLKNNAPRKNILAIPLTGENRILGAIEIIDATRYEKQESYILEAYIAAQVFSRAVGSMLRSEIISAIGYSSTQGIDVVNRSLDSTDYLRNVTNKIIASDLINYDVAITRVYSRFKEEVTVEYHDQHSEIDWSAYIESQYPNIVGISSECYLNKKTIHVENINKNSITKFRNIEWITTNRLRAFICVPIVFDDQCLGTLSLFLKYPYRFYNADFTLLNLYAHSIGKTLGLERKITELKRENADRAKAAVREISDLVSIKEFAHAYKNDLRTILHTLNKTTPTLTKGRISDLLSMSEWIQTRQNELESFISNTRGEYGIKKEFSINDLIDEIISHYSTEAELEKITVEKNFGATEFLLMDRNRLFEAISNIYLNAIKSLIGIPNTKLKIISVSTYHDTSTDDYCIQITDNGVGFSNEIVDSIFEEGVSYFKGDAGDGTGQGLFYSKQIMDDFCGDIEAISTVGSGSTFTITFPIDLFRK